MSKVNHQNKV